MKKYGDDADSFHDQGTRVDESRQGHEQNKLRHYYNYSTPSKHKSRNNAVFTNEPKHNYKHNYSTCSECGRPYDKNRNFSCPYCHSPGPAYLNKQFSSSYVPKYAFTETNSVTCRKCGKKYDWNEHGSCPYCKSNQGNKDILVLWFVLILILIIIFVYFV